MNDRIQLKEWPRFDGEAFLLGQNFTGRVICENTGTESDISLSFRAIEILESKDATGNSRRQNILFKSVQRAGRRGAAVETRDRIEWWFGFKTPLVCDKSYNLSELGLVDDARYCPGSRSSSALPPSFPAKNGASVEYELVLEVKRAHPYGQRILRCILPFVAAAAAAEAITPLSAEPAAKPSALEAPAAGATRAIPAPTEPTEPTEQAEPAASAATAAAASSSPSTATAHTARTDSASQKVSVADGVRARGRFTLERQFRTLLPDDPELQVPSRRFDASLLIPSAVMAGRPASFQVAVRHLGLATEAVAEENEPTFRLVQLRLEIRGTTIYRVRNEQGEVENRSARGAWRRFVWKGGNGSPSLPSDGQPVTVDSVVNLPSYSRDTTFIPSFRTFGISHGHELKADIYVQHVETGHYFSFESESTYPITVVPGPVPEEEAETNGSNGAASNPQANGSSVPPSRGENSLVLEDVSPPIPAAVRRSSTYDSISSQGQSRKSWGRRFSLQRLNTWRKSTDALSQLASATNRSTKT